MKTIIGIVGDLDRVFVGITGNHTQHGAENLFSRDCHIVCHAHEYRWLREVTPFEALWMAFSADQYFSAFFDAFADVGLYAFVLLLRHHRSYSGLGIGWVADGEGAHGVRNGALDGVKPLARH